MQRNNNKNKKKEKERNMNKKEESYSKEARNQNYESMKMNNSKAYLVNTGWNGRGERISLKNTRSIIDNILNDKIDNVPTTNIPIFNLEVPMELNNMESEIFDPRKSWDSNIAWENKATELAKLFIANFNQFCDSENGKNLVKFGPQV